MPEVTIQQAVEAVDALRKEVAALSPDLDKVEKINSKLLENAPKLSVHALECTLQFPMYLNLHVYLEYKPILIMEKFPINCVNL